MNLRIPATAFIGGLMLSTSAFAQGVTFESIDADQDGFLTYEEATAVIPSMTDEAFKEIDGDQDGRLSPDEFANARL